MSKIMILLGGMPASGKTTLGKKISQRFQLPYLDKDTLCDQYTNFVVARETKPQDRSSDFYKKVLRPLEYQILWKVALEQVSLGLVPVVVSPFSSEFPSKEKLQELKDSLKAQDPEVKLVTILLATEEDVVKQNMIKRNRPEDADKISQWENYFQEKKDIQDRSRQNVDFVIEASDPDSWPKIVLFFEDLGLFPRI